MTVFRLRNTLAYLVAGLIFGIVVQAILFTQLAAAPASVVVAATDYSRTVRPGSLVAVEFSAEKSRECISQTSRWLWRDTANGRREILELSYAAMAFGHDTPDKYRDYRFMFEVPATTPPGDWNVRTLHADYCWPWSWFLGPRLRTSPPLGLRILPAQ